ncbi:ATP-dependent helicase HrpB [Amorphus sp. 3PC139-8]|uniref:ATP-dependent helicase HrpB n=1 Tax=Amorphus sp. 3PC139-8 TaxID=2735676 RepID=UPI00345C8EDE
MTTLPVEAALPELLGALERGAAAVLVAPPGAGKSTRVPLALLDTSWRGDGRILVLEPRRLAARAAARRMAETLGEKVGERVGYRVRMDARVSAATRVEVITSGVFTRMIVDDPELSGVAAVLFDEVHERALDTDLGLALALDTQGALRPDIRLLAMSATADAERIARLLGDAPVIVSEGRSYPVETRHRAPASGTRMEEAVADAVRHALATETGSILAFLPGRAEIERTATRLSDLPDGVDVVPLHGGLDGKAQDAAIRPARSGRRKVVLATPIAETSITIEGVRVVVDSGYVRRPRFEPATGLTRLVTERVSRAAADQRRGRAGRTEPGVAIRLWPEGQTAALLAFDPPEILEADLSALVLDLAEWGVSDPGQLSWLDPPPAAAWREAVALADALGAIDRAGALTAEGKALRALPLPPRLAHMVHAAAGTGEAGLAAEIALILTEQGLGGRDTSLAHRIESLRRDRSDRARTARAVARGWAEAAGGAKGEGRAIVPLQVGRLTALAYPDRVAQARGQTGGFRTAGGRGGLLDPADALAREAFLAVAELQGAARNARILLAAPLDAATIETTFADRIEEEDVFAFDPEVAAVRQTKRRRLGGVVLSERRTVPKPGPETVAALLNGVAKIGLDRWPWSNVARQLRDRLAFLHRTNGPPWPQVDDEALAAGLGDWLGPFVPTAVALSGIKAGDLEAALSALVPPDRPGDLDRLAPARVEISSGRSLSIDYDGEEPSISVRVQDLFGLAVHPSIAGGDVPLVVHLLSPADRPIQVTRDLPGFWRGSWSDVRKDLKGRYPKHNWPEDPTNAPPTRLKKHVR